MAQQRLFSPRSAALVPSTATGPMECQELMALDFKSQIFLAYAYLPSYSDWFLYDADLTSTYQYERRALQLLQWGTPARPWRLKCPTHLLFLDELDRSFPDARFVMTHRDPADVIVSVADVYLEIGGMFSEEIDLHYLGALNLEHWSVGMERALAFRDRGNDHRFYDIDFRTMQTDPIGEVTKLYAWLGEPVTPEFEAGMATWWQEFAAQPRAERAPRPGDVRARARRRAPAVRRVHEALGAVDGALSRTRSRVDAERVEQFERVVPQPPRGVGIGDARVEAAPRMRVGAHGQRLGAVLEHEAAASLELRRGRRPQRRRRGLRRRS